MRIWRLSASRQPCSAGSCIVVTREFVVGAEGHAEMQTGPFQKFRLWRPCWKPQRHAVIMRDCQPAAPWAQRRDRRRSRAHRMIFPRPCHCGRGGLSGRPRHRAIGMKRDVVDPAPFRIGRKQRDLAPGVERNDLAVVAALTIRSPSEICAQDRAAMDGNLRNRAVVADHGDIPRRRQNGRGRRGNALR